MKTFPWFKKKEARLYIRPEQSQGHSHPVLFITFMTSRSAEWYNNLMRHQNLEELQYQRGEKRFPPSTFICIPWTWIYYTADCLQHAKQGFSKCSSLYGGFMARTALCLSSVIALFMEWNLVYSGKIMLVRLLEASRTLLWISYWLYR